MMKTVKFPVTVSEEGVSATIRKFSRIKNGKTYTSFSAEYFLLGNPYDHPAWHFIDYPLELPDFPDKSSPTPTNDILYGISQSEKFIKDTNSPPEVRAA
jgi:hypothetical protein